MSRIQYIKMIKQLGISEKTAEAIMNNLFSVTAGIAGSVNNEFYVKTEIRIPVEVYSRVCGYFRPVNQWNKGKQSEFEDRVNYKL